MTPEQVAKELSRDSHGLMWPDYQAAAVRVTRLPADSPAIDHVARVLQAHAILKAENERYRAALERVADPQHPPHWSRGVARCALEPRE